ncbi:hypothetical protein ABZ883_04680 [Streptomyces sp. NPDC046977]|uniref:hypothetical protein n=1 Tax=Streptomyces sp. NPDC046977 TaxID=3154703 RepID=UPI0033D0EFB0
MTDTASLGQAPAAISAAEWQAASRKFAMDAWGSAYGRANTTQATVDRIVRVLVRWGTRDLHRDAAQLLNELLAALGPDAQVPVPDPRDTTAGDLRDAVLRATSFLTEPQRSEWPAEQVHGWNLAMQSVRDMVGELAPGGAAVVQPPVPPQATAPAPVDDNAEPDVTPAQDLRTERAELLGLLCASLPLRDSVICQPPWATDWYLLVATVLGERLHFFVTEDDMPYLVDVRWVLPDDPSVHVAPLSAEQRQDRVRRLIGDHVLVRDARPGWAQATTPPVTEAGATAIGSGVLTLNPPTTSTTGLHRA